MTILIPKPIRDCFSAARALDESISLITSVAPGSAGAAVLGIFGGGALTLPPANKLIQTAGRIALAALGFVAFQFTGGYVTAACVLGSLISLPAVAIVGSTSLSMYGISAAWSSLFTGCLTTLGLGLAGLAGGAVLSELYDIVPFGIGDCAISSLAEKLEKPLVKDWRREPARHF